MINPDVILDFSQLAPDMSQQIEILGAKVQWAKELTVGISLTEAEVALLTCLFRSSPLPLNPPGDNEHHFNKIKLNAEREQIRGGGMFLPRRENSVLDNFLGRSLRYREYQRGTKSAIMVLLHFMALYQYYDDDNYHSLDYKMDRSLDYSSHVVMFGGKFAELDNLGPSEVEHMAQLYFFAIVAVFEKLEKHQASSQGTYLNRKESMAILTWFSQCPPLLYPKRHKKSMESVESAVIRSAEFLHLLTYVQRQDSLRLKLSIFLPSRRGSQGQNAPRNLGASLAYHLKYLSNFPLVKRVTDQLQRRRDKIQVPGKLWKCSRPAPIFYSSSESTEPKDWAC
jgi:hypothetical protein